MPIIREDVKTICNNIGPDLLKFDGKCVFITGMNGLLGSYIAEVLAFANEFLLDKPCIIVGLVRSKSERLAHLEGRRDVIFAYGDVKHEYTTFYINPDYIVHAAGRGTPSYFVEHSVETIQNNMAVTWMLQGCNSYNSQMIYLSSSEIYGNAEVIPTPETYAGVAVTPDNPRACYINSKRCAETLCLSYAKERGVKVKILRPMLVYGPGLDMYDQRVLCDFMRAGIEKKPIILKDSGEALRSYCYISDATTMIFKAMLHPDSPEIYNIGNQNETISIKELANIVGNICGVEVITPEASNLPLEALSSAPSKCQLDMSKVAQKLGFCASTTLSSGLQRTIQWNRTLYKF